MRVFFFFFVYRSYAAVLDSRLKNLFDFAGRRAALVKDRYCAVHYLEPDHASDGDVFLTSNAYPSLQNAWAATNGLSRGIPLNEIMLAQVEAHRSDVFYTQDPAHYGPRFLKRLPGCVRRRVCWQSPPAPPGDLTSYDLVLNNFPASLDAYGEQG